MSGDSMARNVEHSASAIKTKLGDPEKRRAEEGPSATGSSQVEYEHWVYGGGAIEILFCRDRSLKCVGFQFDRSESGRLYISEKDGSSRHNRGKGRNGNQDELSERSTRHAPKPEVRGGQWRYRVSRVHARTTMAT